jgi:dienelactone hydrolase
MHARNATSVPGNPLQVELHIYPGRNHAFARPVGNHYVVADATMAHGRMVSLSDMPLPSNEVTMEP